MMILLKTQKVLSYYCPLQIRVVLLNLEVSYRHASRSTLYVSICLPDRSNVEVTVHSCLTDRIYGGYEVSRMCQIIAQKARARF